MKMSVCRSTSWWGSAPDEWKEKTDPTATAARGGAQRNLPEPREGKREEARSTALPRTLPTPWHASTTMKHPLLTTPLIQSKTKSKKGDKREHSYREMRRGKGAQNTGPPWHTASDAFSAHSSCYNYEITKN